MISKQQQKYIQSLHLKKYRQLNQEFIVEGRKNILELIESDYIIRQVFTTAAFNDAYLDSYSAIKKEIISENELEKISTLQSNDSALAVVSMKQTEIPILENNGLALALDNINDPGNLGTIIRIADWYNIKHVFCSENTVEFYNPKVIMATMGSFTRITPHYVNLQSFLNKSTVPIYGAFLDGENVHQKQTSTLGILVIGNESHGISVSIEEEIQHKLTIPRFGNAESLNAGIATALLLDNLIRINNKK